MQFAYKPDLCQQKIVNDFINLKLIISNFIKKTIAEYNLMEF